MTVYEALMNFYPLTLDDLPSEEWLPVPDYPKYEVSNFGRVKSFKHRKPRILALGFTRGYLHVMLYKDGKEKNFYVHRLVARAFIPNSDNKPQINHIDGNKFNNFVGNLEWATQSENQQHALDTGLSPQGEDRPEAKLTNEQVRLIRENPDNLSQSQLAKIFNVDRAAIGYVQRGETYKTAGGIIRGKIDTRTPDNIRAQIRAEYVYGSKEFGSYALAKKFGVTPKTILNIVREVSRK